MDVKHAEFARVRETWSRRKWLAMLVFIGVLAPVLTIAKSVPNIYRSTAIVLVEPKQLAEAVVRPSSEASARSFWTNELETRLHTISQEILSRARLEELISRLGLYPDLRGVSLEAANERMRRDIKIEPREVGQTGVWGATIAFTLSYRGTEPKTVAEVVNALASSYVEGNLKIRERQATSTTEFLRAQLAAAKVRLDEQERRIREFKQRYGSELPERFAMVERLSTLVRLNGESQLGAMERRAALGKQLGELELSAGGADTPAARLARLKLELIELSERFTDKYPEVIRVKGEIAALERGPAAPDQDGRSGQPTDPTLRRLKQLLNELDAQTKALKTEEQRLRREIAAYQRGLENAPEREQQLQALSRDSEAAKELHASLSKRHEDALLAEQMERQKGDQFRILDPAIPANQPAGPNRLLLVVYGLMLSLGVSAGAVVLAERLDTSFHSLDELRSFTKLAVLASIPHVGNAAETARLTRRRWLATVSITLGLVLVVLATYHVANGNAQLVRMLSRGAP